MLVFCCLVFSFKINIYFMDRRFSLREFVDDYEFEDYLATNCKWQGWTLFQNHIVTMPHMTFGLFDSSIDTMVAATTVSYLKSDDVLYIHLFQTRDDLHGKGYGQQLLRMLVRRFVYEVSGFRLQYTNNALGFWLKMGFYFDEDMNFMVK